MKAQGMSINTIIIAAVALIVLVVLIAVFSGRMSLFGQDLTKAQQEKLCKGSGMKMVQGNDCNDLGGDWEVVYSNFRQCEEDEDPSSGCYKPGYVCCVEK